MMFQKFLQNVAMLFGVRIPLVLVYYLCPKEIYDSEKGDWLCSDQGYKSDFGANAKLVTLVKGPHAFLYVTNPGRLIDRLRGFPLVAAWDLNEQDEPMCFVQLGQRVNDDSPLIVGSLAEMIPFGNGRLKS